MSLSIPVVFALMGVVSGAVFMLMLTRLLRERGAVRAGALGKSVSTRKAAAIDLDTFSHDGVNYRLKGVDGMEKGGAGVSMAEKAMGEAGRQIAQNIARRGLVFWPTGEISHGRVVAWIETSDGADYGALITQLGLAKPWHGETPQHLPDVAT